MITIKKQIQPTKSLAQISQSCQWLDGTYYFTEKK